MKIMRLMMAAAMTVALNCAAQCDMEILGFNPLTTNITLVVNGGHCGTEADSIGEFLLGITFDPPLIDNPWPCMYQNGWASLIFPLDFPGFNIGQGDDDILQTGDTITFALNEVPFFGSGSAQCWMEAMADGVYYEEHCVIMTITQINDSESLTGSQGLGGFPYPDENLWNNWIEFTQVSPWNQIGVDCDAPPPPLGEVPPEPEYDPCNDDVIFVPNCFTPNNDGKNDVFRPVLSGECWLWFRFTVYNRWGRKVFESDHPGDIWRGENNSKWGQGRSYCPDGVYLWMITGQKYGNVWTDLHGHVTLLR